MADTAEKTELSEEEKILRLARTRMKNILTATDHIVSASLEDIKFTYNIEEGQWPEDVRAEREEDNRPCLTSNKLRKFVAVVANQERENRVAIEVRPVDDKSDPATAGVIEDLVRQIEFASDADQIYSAAGEQAAAGGYGYFRIVTRIPEDGFEQEIFLEHIENQFSVQMDPKGQYGFISDWMPRMDFEEEYPDADMVSFAQEGIGEIYEGWYEPDKVRIAEYFTKVKSDRRLVKVKKTDTGEISVVELEGDETAEQLKKGGFEILKERTSKGHKVKWYKITGAEILEEGEFPASEIPIIEVVGDKVNISGKEYKRSLIRDGKDPQRMYNYWLTTETETVALAPKAPYLVTANEISGHENMWKDANRKNLPYLLFNPQGQRVPQREKPPQVSPGHTSMMQIANDDIKDTLGMFESFTGEQGNERSGRAILARQQRGQVATLHFPDNLRRAVIKCGKILIEMIPKVYDTERTLRIRGKEGNEVFVPINHTFKTEDGKEITVNDLQRGKYDVIADVRLYATRRQESSEMVLQAMQYAPGMAPFLVDLLFKFMDAAGADEVKQRVEQFMEAQRQGQVPQGGPGGQSGTGGPGGPIPPSDGVPANGNVGASL